MEGVILMIVFDRFFKTIEKKGITQYNLYTYKGINRSLLHKLKNNKGITTHVLNRLCEVLDCNVEDICEYVKEDKKE